MSKEPRILLGHILESIKLINEHVASLNREDFLASIKTQDAVLRRLEIVGEALNNTTKQFKENHTEIPWREIIGMRNIVIHDYDNVNIEILWNTLSIDIPTLKKDIERILAHDF